MHTDCSELYLSIPEMGVYRSACNGTWLEPFVADETSANAISVVVHKQNEMVYWANDGNVFSAEIEGGENVTAVFNSTEHFLLTNGSAIEFITIIDDYLVMSSEAMNEVYFLELGVDSDSAARMIEHHKIHGVTNG